MRFKLAGDLAKRRQGEDLEHAQAWFAKHTEEFRSGKRVFFSEAVIPLPDIIDVPLTRAQVERYHLEHIDRYSASEQTRVRHILVSPTGSGAEADAAARKKAETLLARVRNGEDFEELARTNSDDYATRADGGDLGFFRHGTMLEDFERAAFKLRPGEVSDVIKSDVGYDIIKCIDYAAPYAEPLSLIYPNVGQDLAAERAIEIAHARADSLRRTLKSGTQARQVANKLGLTVMDYEAEVGDPRGGVDFRKYVVSLDKLKIDEIAPEPYFRDGIGYSIAWLAGKGDPTIRDWNRISGQVVQRYRQDLGRQRARLKRAELDSMYRAGWSFDSLGTLWGGLRNAQLKPGEGLAGLGGGAAFDSVIFGTAKTAAVAQVGEVRDWIEMPTSQARFRLDERHVPSANEMASHVQTERRRAVDSRFNDYFRQLKKRYGTTILDPELRAIPLPEELQSES